MMRRHARHSLTTALGIVLTLAAGLATAHASGAETDRKILQQTHAEYPQLAREMRVTGTVRLNVTVLPNGQVEAIEVVSGHPLLQNPATRAVRQWRFAPGPNTTQVDVKIVFTIP